MEIFLILLAILVIFLIAIGLAHKRVKTPPQHPKQRYDSRGFDHNHIHINGTKYDNDGFDYRGYNAEGYDREGYTIRGKNKKGQYDRWHDKTSGEEEGFYDPRFYPVALTDHVITRMGERLNINQQQKMLDNARKAYRFGKSKRHIKKTSAYLLEEMEAKYDNSIALIYNGYIYIFTRENALKTFFKNDRIPL